VSTFLYLCVVAGIVALQTLFYVVCNLEEVVVWWRCRPRLPAYYLRHPLPWSYSYSEGYSFMVFDARGRRVYAYLTRQVAAKIVVNANRDCSLC
jgi:hypothetical protein